jgi:hypothetical protein
MNDVAGYRRHATILLRLAIEVRKHDRPEIADKLLQLATVALERAEDIERGTSQRVVQQPKPPQWAANS